MKRLVKKRSAKVIPLREDSGDVFDVIRSWGYEIYVGDELCKGDVLEAVRHFKEAKAAGDVERQENQENQGPDGSSEAQV